VRHERADDAAAVRKVNLAAFGGAAEADVVDALRANCSDLLSLVAVDEGQVIGHVLFSPAVIEGSGTVRHGMGLAPVAVQPARQRQGVGSALIRAGISELKERGCPFIVVLGHAGYYPRFGFVEASRYGIRSEWDVPDEAFMILPLNEASVGVEPGVARYRPEFSSAV
jgi:putative acetyltransferase